MLRHPDRDAQFRHIADRVRRFHHTGDPVISVDTKKKELVGQYENAGQTWRPKKNPERVNVHDFKDPALGKAVPYGVYDLKHNTGWVTVGQDHDTATFAVQTLRRWWEQVGSPTYPKARRLLICADAGGSNGARVRLWKWELCRLIDQIAIPISVCHFPPGTSKWNKIEHRLFAHISMNWRGQPLTSHEVVVNLIGSTATRTGLRVHAEHDTGTYPKGGQAHQGGGCAHSAASQARCVPRRLELHDQTGTEISLTATYTTVISPLLCRPRP